MKNFNDNEYTKMIACLLHDTQYIEASNMGKMSGLRKHGEVLVRKILNIGSDEKIMLGQIRSNSNNQTVKIEIDNFENKYQLSKRLFQIVRIINDLGNKGTHTQHTDDFSNEEIESVEDAILDLYAIIFIMYFLDNKVSLYSSKEVMFEFSLLPPVIRYKTWSYLYEKDKNNIQVVNKLCLSIIKTFDKTAAYKWLNDNKKLIKEIPFPTESEIKKYIKSGYEVSPGEYFVSINFIDFDNMYDLLHAKIDDPNTSINESGEMYKNFEEAIKYYKKNKMSNIENKSKEEREFHSLIEFVFIGRKSKDELTV